VNKQRALRKLVALGVLAAMFMGLVPVSAVQRITIGSWIPPDQWNGRWAPQVSYCTAQTGLELDNVLIPHGTYSEKLMLMEVVGDTPDVLLIPPERVAAVVGAGIVEDLEPWVKEKNLDQRNWFPGATNSTKFGGITFGLPAYVVNYTYAYNKDILSQRGIVPPKNNEWITWDRVWEIAKKSTIDQDGDGIPEIYGFFNNTTFVQTLAFIRQAGGEVYNKEGLVQFNTEPVREAVDFLRNLIEENLHAPSSTYFNQHKLATIRLGSGSLVNKTAEIDPIPMGVAAGIQYKAKADVTYVTPWAMSARSAKKEQAWQFMTCMVSSGAQEMVAARGVVPMRRDTKIPPDRMEVLTGLINNLEYAVSYPYHLENEYVQKAWDIAMKPVFNGQASPNAVLESLDQTINAYLKQKMK
jgi:ABC-type glycerol-3-phosphate transport system substrate-binding protein